MGSLLTALAQVNVTVGALTGNAELLARRAGEAANQGASLIVFPELALCGYPPEDLILKRDFVEECEARLEALAGALPADSVVLVGTPRAAGSRVHNAAAVFAGGRLVAFYDKLLLPNYGVFDEKRLFVAGDRVVGLRVGNARLGIHICEDSWYTDERPCTAFENAGLDAIINLSSSPYHHGKVRERREILAKLARELETHVLYCNLVGGQDELVFDGASEVLAPSGEVAARAKQFEEDILYFSLPVRDHPASETASAEWVKLSLPAGSQPPPGVPARVEELLEGPAEVYGALKLGLRDYVDKNDFEKCVVAISGGIDSALVAMLAVDALGKDRVAGLTMPSEYSSSGTIQDAERLAESLDIEFYRVPIGELFKRYLSELEGLWPGRSEDSTEENIQARIRGNIVMALSNKFGWLVLATGNKSELATGYCTLYGDMVGGFSVLKDVPKSLVFELARWRNGMADEPVIPESTIERPPSAELRPDQRDTDSLPPYNVLDPILERYVERDFGIDQIIAEGFDAETVRRVIHMVDANEYKRRQGPPGVKITPKAFGRDRRLPITNRYGKP